VPMRKVQSAVGNPVWLCVTRQQMTGYAGLGPIVRESGSSVRERAQIGQAGNRRLRPALYLATLSAAQHNSVIRAF
jgi:transposase